MDLQAIGHWYANFSSTSDEEVCRLLESARAEQGAFASSKGAQERA
jgi:predicted phosphoribosyltransferase